MAKSLRQKAAPTDARRERNPGSTILSGCHFSRTDLHVQHGKHYQGGGVAMFCTRGSSAGVCKAIRVSVIGVLTMFLALVSAAQTPTALYNFNANNSGDPLGFSNSGTLAQGQDGNIYTT